MSWGYVRLQYVLQDYRKTEAQLKTYDPPISVRLGKERAKRLKRYCQVLDLKMSAIICQLVDEWLERMAPKVGPAIEELEKALRKGDEETTKSKPHQD